MLTKLSIIFLFVCVYLAEAEPQSENFKEKTLNDAVGGSELLEQGRTLVHHAVKRMMIILPAIFFKLGIAFTLLIIVALAAVNNGFIGFMLLVVGLSSVLARFQESRTAAVSVPYVHPLPPYHHSVWDRSDNGQGTKEASYGGYSGQNYQYSPQMTGYYTKYGSTKI